MRLSQLLAALPSGLAPTARGASEADPVVRGLCYDSRAVAPGDCFVALRGALADGHAFLEEAVRLGAVALVVEEAAAARALERPWVAVSDSRRALAWLATRFYGRPGDELGLVGVTGTNGKTSVTYLCESMLRCAGRKVGLIGTVEMRYADERFRALNTTPESLDLQRALRDMCTRGLDSVVMEVSSHGVAMGRVLGCRFAVGAMTNLSQDHLDFHGTMEAYLRSKTDFFEHHLRPDGTAVVNADDPSAPAFLAAAERAGVRTLRVSRDPESDAEVVVERARIDLDGTEAGLRLPRGRLSLRLPLVGDFNVENLAVAVGIGCALELPPEALREGVATCPQVPGRVERVGSSLPGVPHVLVDYAHTPDAVEKVLRTLRPLTAGRLIAVFGCGGDRDRGKRPLMARAVARHADRVVVTSDNPRTEDPEAILDDVEAGLADLERVAPEQLDVRDRSYSRLGDRRAAIELAVGIARREDTVVIAGKGHEDYQIIGRERLPFDDRDEARRALARRGAA